MYPHKINFPESKISSADKNYDITEERICYEANVIITTLVVD